MYTSVISNSDEDVFLLLRVLLIMGLLSRTGSGAVKEPEEVIDIPIT
jgi:hypothetical protein